MSQFSVIFNPATDNQEEVIKSVQRLFDIFAVLTPAAAIDSDETGDTPTTATHDSTGLPHDARIHSAPAVITTKGVWRAKRGVDKQLVAQVESELRGAASVVGINEARTATTEQPIAPPAAPAPVAPGLPAMPAPIAPVATAYTELCKVLSENQCTPANPQGRLTDEWIKAALAAYLVPGGVLQNAAAMEETAVAQMVTGIKTALGMAV